MFELKSIYIDIDMLMLNINILLHLIYFLIKAIMITKKNYFTKFRSIFVKTGNKVNSFNKI